MTAVPEQTIEATSLERPWRVVGQGAAALGAGVGIGRFAYTAILPLMHAQAGLSPQLGAQLATANYIGYLLGAVAPIIVPAMGASRLTLRLSLVVLIVTLALMPITHVGVLWWLLRLVAGIASSLIFVVAVNAMLTGLRGHAHHLTGWAFGGIGAGIALSGVVVLILRTAGTWQQAWWTTAVLTAVFTALAWRLHTGPASSDAAPASSHPALASSDAAAPVPSRRGAAVGLRWFGALLVSYTLEGTGYIIAGTFLVAAIDQTAPGWVGSSAWILVGLAALPSSALWAWLSRTWSRPTLLLVALVVQAVGIALPVLAGGVAAALVSAVLFGATFLGIASLTLAIGAHLRIPRAVAILATGYSVGQILGPLVVTPLLRQGYHQALLVGAALVALAAVAAGPLRHRFPHHLGPLPRLVDTAQPTPITTTDRRAP
ncbi:YbfB/YjiJ family MFS transporter [Nonomuraea sp. NEAU-L178]|nr:YbfB/YjiJ family MFS transporter [Nonomuraea aurantiaca]MCA2225269.1 YbfB/YjiJ family MFS transporter [Nonomuraea aurantiaca]